MMDMEREVGPLRANMEDVPDVCATRAWAVEHVLAHPFLVPREGHGAGVIRASAVIVVADELATFVLKGVTT